MSTQVVILDGDDADTFRVVGTNLSRQTAHGRAKQLAHVNPARRFRVQTLSGRPLAEYAGEEMKRFESPAP